MYVDVQGWHLYLKDITVEKDLKMNQVPTCPVAWFTVQFALSKEHPLML